MLGADACDLVSARRDKACAATTLRHGRKSRPADAGAPRRRRAAVQHHRGAIAGAAEIDRLEILVLLQPKAVEHVAREDRQPRSLGAERHGLADRIADGLIGLSARTTNMPGEEYMAVRILADVFVRPSSPMKAS